MAIDEFKLKDEIKYMLNLIQSIKEWSEFIADKLTTDTASYAEFVFHYANEIEDRLKKLDSREV